MLQQTQVTTVIGCFNRFIQAFPSIKTLTQAEEDAVLAEWPGLGYYAHARNLQRSAKIMLKEHQGTVPNTVPQLLALPGGKLVVEHGHRHDWHRPSHDALRNTHADAKMVVYGHTHKQVIDQQQMPWVVNPGAAGQIRNGGSSKCLILTTSDTRSWEITPYRFI